MKAFVKLLPSIAWFTIILYLLTLPGSDLPKIGWMDYIYGDKLIHMGLFFMLTFLFFWGIVSTKPGLFSKKTIFIIALFGLAYGIAMEFVQKYWIPNRSFDVWDILADGVGSFLPLLFIGRMKKLFRVKANERL